MLLYTLMAIALLAGARSSTLVANAAARAPRHVEERHHGYEKISPKVVIVSMFSPEAEVWYSQSLNSSIGDLLADNITVHGLSPLYPNVHCNECGEVCQLTMGESEINAATSMAAFVFSGLFDLTKTYFLLAGIAGVNPKLGTLGSVALSKYSVQVALQYEFDAREMPANFTTGYLPYGAYAPDEYPSIIYGTEVMELNENLRDVAAELAQRAELADSVMSADYRTRYATSQAYEAATTKPSVIKCDSATSDVYYSGTLLSEAFENTTMLWTNQSTVTYCMSAQEDSAILEVLVRAAACKLVDFSRAIAMRTGSDFDRPPPSVGAFENLRIIDQNGFDIAIQNLYLAGVEIVEGILAGWDAKFHEGIAPTNYIGDIIGTLGGDPDFGSGSLFDGLGFSAKANGEIGLTKRKAPSGRKGRRAGGWK